MAHFLFANIPEKNHLYPMVPVMLQLSKDGHNVSCACHSLMLEKLPAGLQKISVDDYQPQQIDPHQEEFEDLYDHLVETAPSIAERYLEIFRKQQPDNILVGSLDFGAAIAAEASGIPWSVIGTNPGMLEPEGGLPCTGRGLDSKSLKSKVAGYFHHRMLGSFAKPLNELRESYGLSALENPLSQQMLQASNYFALTLKSLEPGNPGFDAKVEFVGPIIWQPAEPEEERLPKKDFTPPVIAVRVSQIEAPDNHVVISRLIEGLSEKNCTVLLETRGEDYEISDFPENFYTRETIDLSRLVPRVHVFIHRGNYLGYAAGIKYGIPSIAIETGAEGREIAIRAKLAGIAENMDVDGFRAKHLNELITKLISEPLYRMMAERLKEELRNQNPARMVAEMLMSGI